MTAPRETLSEKRQRLAAQIARQRGELARAYDNLQRPVHYTEYAMRGFGFVRENPWVFSVVPAVVTITATIVGLVRNKPVPAPKRGRGWLPFTREPEREREAAAARKAKGLLGHAATWAGRGWKLFRTYRKYRKFL